LLGEPGLWVETTTEEVDPQSVGHGYTTDTGYAFAFVGPEHSVRVPNLRSRSSRQAFVEVFREAAYDLGNERLRS